MPQVFNPNEVWQVSTGKDKFILNGSQAQLVKNASIAGQRGLIFFDGFAISLAHIVSMNRTKSVDDISQRQKTIEKVDEMKKILNV